MFGQVEQVMRVVLAAMLFGLGACAYPQGAVFPEGVTVSVPKGGGSAAPVRGRQRLTIEPSVRVVQVSFTNGTPVSANITFQAPYQTIDLGVVSPLGTRYFTYVRPSVYRGTRIKVHFIVQALDDDGIPIATEVVEERIGRNDQTLASGVRRMRLPRGLY